MSWCVPSKIPSSDDAHWDSGRGRYGDASNSGTTQREGLMSYKQFIQELEDDILPAEAERRYQEYKSEYISTQKRAFFDAHKDEEWLRDKYHPTNLVTVIERRNELARKVAKDFFLDLQSGTLDLGGDRKDNNNNNNRQLPPSDDPNLSPPAPPPPRRRDRDSRERRDRDYYDRNRSPPPPPTRERDYKRRSSISPPPPPLNYRDRRHSPPPRRSPPYKRSRREDGGYEGRRGSPRGGFGPGDRFGYDYGGGYDREMMGRPGYPDDRPHGRYFGRSSGGYQTPGVNALSANKSGQTSEPNSEDETDIGGKRRRHGRGPTKETDILSLAPKAHLVSSDPRRIQIDIGQAQGLVRKLDSEKGIEENILNGSDNDKISRDKSHGSFAGPVIIVRGLTSVKGLEGVELLDSLITYLWRVHGVDYYGMIETSEAKGFRHVRAEGKSSDITSNGSEWEKKLDSYWQDRLRGQDPLEVMTAKDKLDAAAVESLDPFVRKIRDEKYGWKYGCGAKGCTKLFHAAEFVHKHLKLKHPELVIELTSKVREELYFQNYMNDPDAPGGTPVMQQPIPKDKPQRRKVMENRLKDERGLRRERDNRANGSDRFDRSENPQSSDFPSNNDGPDGGNHDDPMFDAFGGQGMHVAAPFSSDIAPPPVLMPVPGAGPLGPFVPAPPELAMQVFRERGGPPFEGNSRSGRPGPNLSGPAPFLLPPGFRQDPRRLRSYQDLDAPEDEVTVIDYRSL
ncbi:hypothetical protein GOBAR_DD29077 [Gossypium barbadense]|nr:hypothetical protein GOBAR_DD29077 [Gossypium barbadense]